MTYLFKDTDIAAQRLQVLADVFAPASRAFMQDAVKTGLQVAVDLGCGPGYTTRLLADMTRCKQAIGIDSSAYFLTLARENAPEHMSFLAHDVTQVPFPIEQSDVMSCRMLLTHLQNPASVIERWQTQLRPHGLLLLEEVEWIQTEYAPFRLYLDIVAALLAQQHNQLYIGSFLDTMHVADGLQRYMSRVYRLPVSTSQAARMFSMNIVTWKKQPFIQQHYAPALIEQLEQDLQALAATPTQKSVITWGMRQLAYERVS
jgi:ubiquinone/menaquinone biosynthesis C-methylase UbiE